MSKISEEYTLGGVSEIGAELARIKELDAEMREALKGANNTKTIWRINSARVTAMQHLAKATAEQLMRDAEAARV